MSNIREIENNLEIAKKRLKKSRIVLAVSIVGFILIIISNFVMAAGASIIVWL